MDFSITETTFSTVSQAAPLIVEFCNVWLTVVKAENRDIIGPATWQTWTESQNDGLSFAVAQKPSLALGLSFHFFTCWVFPSYKCDRICSSIPISISDGSAGPCFNIKMSSYHYRKSHWGDKTVVRSSYLHNRISYTGKMSSLYWIGVLVVITIVVKVRFLTLIERPNEGDFEEQLKLRWDCMWK